MKPKQKQNFSTSLWLNKNKTKKRPTIFLVGFFIVSAVISWFIVVYSIKNAFALTSIYFSRNSPPSLAEKDSAVTENNNIKEEYFRRLDGKIMENSKQANYWPYAVMIENLLSVRPQSGLSQASVVYETLAEGGATRFMAVLDPSEIINEIGPVRSARPYYLEWSSEYDALYVHCGGSPRALQIIWENPDIKNLNQISRDSKYFWRDKTKSAPHNLFTSSEKINFALRDKSLADKQVDFQSWKFKDEADLGNRGDNGKSVIFNFSYGLTYKVRFEYNRDKNVYLRFNADQPHLDKNTNKQIEVKNVIVQLVEEPVFEGEKGRLDIYVGGEGKAWIFRDGQVIEGIWKKASRKDRTLFYDQTGQEVEFNRGNTWVHVIPKTQEVKYE